jgi:hypothetical protein
LASAVKELRASVAIASQLAEKDPANTDWQSNLSSGHKMLADALRLQNDYAGALTEAREALAIMVQLAAKDPANAEWQLRLSWGTTMSAPRLDTKATSLAR